MASSDLDELVARQPTFVAHPQVLDARWLSDHAVIVAPPMAGGEITVVVVVRSASPLVGLDSLDPRLRTVVVDASPGGSLVVPDGVALIRLDAALCDGTARNAGAAMAQTRLVTFAKDCFPEPAAVLHLLSRATGVATTLRLPSERESRLPGAWSTTVWDRSSFTGAGGFDSGRCGFEAQVLAHRLVEVHGVAAENFLSVADDHALREVGQSSCPTHLCAGPSQFRAWWVERDFPLLAHTRSALVPDARATEPLEGVAALRRSAIKESSSRRRSAWAASSVLERAARPVVAVVVTSYNMTGALDRAARSVLSQLQDGIELVIVDDASTDPEAVATAERLSNVATVVVREVNGGAAAARNSGIAATKAPIVVCLDGDDELAPEFVGDVLRVFDLLPTTEIVATHVRYTGDRTDKWRVRDGATVVNALAESPCGISTALRRTVWERVGGFDESMRGYEDWEFWIRALAGAPPLRAIPRPHFRYAVSATSKVNTSNANADAIVAYIASKHADLYLAHFAEVLAIKHRQVLYARRRALAAVNAAVGGDAVRDPSHSERKRARGWLRRWR